MRYQNFVLPITLVLRKSAAVEPSVAFDEIVSDVRDLFIHKDRFVSDKDQLGTDYQTDLNEEDEDSGAHDDGLNNSFQVDSDDDEEEEKAVVWDSDLEPADQVPESNRLSDYWSSDEDEWFTGGKKEYPELDIVFEDTDKDIATGNAQEDGAISQNADVSDESEEDEEEEEDDDPIHSALSSNGLWSFEAEKGYQTLKHGDLSLRLESVAGEGGNGIVFRAKDRSTGRTFAVKFVDASDTQGGADNIESEYALLSQLQREGGIVRIFGPLGQLEGEGRNVHAVKFMVMEVLRKPYELFMKAFVDKPLVARVKFVASFAYYAVLTLRKLHTVHQIAHCDIHASAFMDTLTGSYRMIDFGKARPVVPSTDRESVDERGYWTKSDNLLLLSLFELNNKVCRPRDDLIRLGEVLFTAWPGPYPQGYAKLESETGGSTSPATIARIKDWKKNLSFKTAFGASFVELNEGSVFPLGASTGTSFVDSFYQQASNLGDDVQVIPYEDLLGSFVATSHEEEAMGLLSPEEALFIENTYAQPSSI
jgi:hypothetical protein